MIFLWSKKLDFKILIHIYIILMIVYNIIKSSAFCSENNEIIHDDYLIAKEQKISIIPPIGGG